MQKIKLIPTKNPVPMPEGGFIDKEGKEFVLPLEPYYLRRLKTGELEIEKEKDKEVVKPVNKLKIKE